jgi:hypothetical protein
MALHADTEPVLTIFRIYRFSLEAADAIVESVLEQHHQVPLVHGPQGEGIRC